MCILTRYLPEIRLMLDKRSCVDLNVCKYRNCTALGARSISVAACRILMDALYSPSARIIYIEL